MLDDMLYSLSQDINLEAASKAAGAMASQVGGPGGRSGRDAHRPAGRGGPERVVGGRLWRRRWPLVALGREQLSAGGVGLKSGPSVTQSAL